MDYMRTRLLLTTFGRDHRSLMCVACADVCVSMGGAPFYPPSVRAGASQEQLRLA